MKMERDRVENDFSKKVDQRNSRDSERGLERKPA